MSFSHSSNFTVHEATLLSAQNTFINESPSPSSGAEYWSPLQRLHAHAAVSATHESSVAAYAPKCKPGTRKQVIEDLIDLVVQPPTEGTSHKPVVWFSGPAGGGKTCIQREVARRLQAHGKLAATYFFSNRAERNPGLLNKLGNASGRYSAGRMLDSVGPFVPTVASQLVLGGSGLEAYVEGAIREDPLIFQKSLAIQAKKLISGPLELWMKGEISRRGDAGPLHTTLLKRLSPLIGLKSRDVDGKAQIGTTPPDVVLIDGIDEIRDHHERAHLLALLRDLALDPNFPFRIIIASRPELDIRTILQSPSFKGVVYHVRLETYDGSDDIRVYFCDEFSRIRAWHPATASIPEGWPPEPTLELLVMKASGQFIFPATVIKFIDNPRRRPQELLDMVLAHLQLWDRSQEESSPLQDLYELYDLVLRQPDVDRNLLKRLLHAITAISSPASYINSPEFLDGLLSFAPGTSSIALCDLHSVLNIPTQEQATGKTKNRFIFFHHKTMLDYLHSPTLTSDLYQSPRDTHLYLAVRCVEHMTWWWSTRERMTNRNKVFEYAAFYWDFHVTEALDGYSEVELPQLIQDFHPGIPWMYGFLHAKSNVALSFDAQEYLYRLLHLRTETDQPTYPKLENRLKHCLDVSDTIREVYYQADRDGLEKSSIDRIESDYMARLERTGNEDENPPNAAQGPGRRAKPSNVKLYISTLDLELISSFPVDCEKIHPCLPSHALELENMVVTILNTMSFTQIQTVVFFASRRLNVAYDTFLETKRSGKPYSKIQELIFLANFTNELNSAVTIILYAMARYKNVQLPNDFLGEYFLDALTPYRISKTQAKNSPPSIKSTGQGSWWLNILEDLPLARARAGLSVEEIAKACLSTAPF
ncbi:hypothetical protein CC1G_14740 [Coprinopsis cinerea okayama7|uniref:Nephrocystin 3-like N-terminal domain-containing protein n=1 Tax=Coprinopsis cinerea (strain Okayama-7 / 130 / ATCC MYA-4618 / FGSC 9003) TaxID=240176 RepID=D6RMT8_COPC7|nr:hypothetical protein CC1G_14740 [Coprinopsis cinerea okayama7\|eukprot:XP_002911311.1 hypothetical protein CC1G_14740 [Coprinopsis cinerea okayama7\